MKKLLLLFLTCFGAFAADYAERGTNFLGYPTITTISNTANAYLVVYDGGYASGSRTKSISVTNFLGLVEAAAGTISVNGAAVSDINLTNSTYIVLTVDGSNVSAYATNLTAAHLATDSVSADELNATGVESELEAVLDLSDLQGAVTDAQVPNNITVDLATLATTATTANAGDSATAFFSSGEIEDARLPSALTRDAEWDTVAKIETATGGGNILLETEVDASAELFALMDDETGSASGALLVFNKNPTLDRVTITPSAADTTALAISGGSTTGSGTTPAATVSHTLNTSGNVNVIDVSVADTASGASTKYIRIRGGVAGTTDIFSVDKAGILTTAAGIFGGTFSSTANISAAGNIVGAANGSGFYLGAANDTILVRDAAATWQMGVDAASPINQTLKGNDGVGTDKAGANVTHAGGQGTGTGRGGALIGKTAPSGTTGSSANAYSERYHFPAKAVTLTESTATTVATIAVPSAKYLGGNCVVTVFASDATDHQSRTLTFPFSAVNKAGTVTAGIGTPVESIAASSGTLTATITAVANGNAVDLKVDATSSLTQTTLSATVSLPAINSNDTAAVTEI